MDENELRRKMQAGELAANNGTVMRTLAIAGCDFKFLKLKGLLLALALLAAFVPFKDNTFADKTVKAEIVEGGYFKQRCNQAAQTYKLSNREVRCIEDKAPSSVSDAELEDLEVKLTPRGIQLQRCVKKDPLVDM